MITSISAYQRFYESLKSPTRKSYAIWLDQFLKHSKASREGLANLQVKEIEDLVINWMIHLKRKAEEGEHLIQHVEWLELEAKKRQEEREKGTI